MNNTSNPFPTVFFLVILFIATGLLLYHSVDQAQLIEQMRVDAAARQAEMDTLVIASDEAQQKVASLEATILALQNMVAELQASKTDSEAQIALLTAEIARLQAELDKALAENTALTLPGAGAPSGTSTTQVTLPPCTCEETIGAARTFQPKALFTTPAFWNLVAGLSLTEIVVIGGLTAHRQRTRRQQNSSPRLTTTMKSGRSLPRKDHSKLIDSRFIDG